MRAAVIAVGIALSACSPSADAPAATAPAVAGPGAADAVAGAAPGAQPPSTLAGRLAGQDCLIIVLDALHAQHLGCYGGNPTVAPEIDDFAQGAVRFTQAWSQTSWTLASTVSLMTGLYQESHGVRQSTLQLGEKADTLAEAFARAGHATLAFTQNPYASAAFGLEQGFQSMRLMPGSDEEIKPGERSADEQLADAVLAALGPRGAGPPRFVYCHFRRPHMPYDAPAADRALFCDPAYAGTVRGVDDDRRHHNNGENILRNADLAELVGRYEAGIHAADRQVGRILAGIDRSSTLVVLLADHGEELAEHGRIGHNFTSYEELVHIPMLWSHPAFATAPKTEQAAAGGARGGGLPVATPAMSIDVMPTLSELFGLGVADRPRQGRSLAPELAGGSGPARAAVFTSSRLDLYQVYAATDGRMKYMVLPSREIEKLFDLQADPGEKSNLMGALPQDAARFRALLTDWRTHQRRMGLDVPVTTDAETDARLQALGYVGEDH